jgi:hypothetical protein
VERKTNEDTTAVNSDERMKINQSGVPSRKSKIAGNSMATAMIMPKRAQILLTKRNMILPSRL